jgi:predicted acyltransferase (DUF342 family)
MSQRLYVQGDVSLNSRLSVLSDVSMSQRLYVQGDVSLNSRLSVLSDVSMSQRLYVQGDVSMNSRLSVLSDVSMSQRLYVQGDVSMNNRLSVLSDVSMSQRLYVGGDVSFNNNFNVQGKSIMNSDVSMNQRLFVGNDLTVYGRLNVNNYTNNSIINTTVTNYSLIISEDLSLNGRLSVMSDTSINGNLYIKGITIHVSDVSINTRLYVQGDVSMNSRLYIGNDTMINKRAFITGDVSMNSKLYVKDIIIVDNDAFLNSRLFSDNIFLPTTGNALTVNALTGSTNYSNNFTYGFSGGSLGFAMNTPNFNMYFSPWNITKNNIFNNFDCYIDNPRNNFILGQYYPGNDSIYNIYSSSNYHTSSNFTNNLVISSGAMANINTDYDSTNNVAVGYNSLNLLKNGHCNTSIGSNSMVNIGQIFEIPSSLINSYNPNASTDSNTSNFNTSIGYFSMSSPGMRNASNKNTAIGALAFSDYGVFTNSSQIYTQNTFIGYNAQPITGVYTNQIVLGTATETTYIPGGLTVYKDTNLNKLTISSDVSLNQRLCVNGDVSFNSHLSIASDVSMGQRLYINGDVYTNSRLFVLSDTSLNRRLYVGGDASMNGQLSVLGNGSFSRTLFIQGDVSMNNRLTVLSDASLGQRLYIQGDVSMNSRLSVLSDVSMSKQLYVAGDVFMNSRLFVSSDVSMNGNVFIQGKTTTVNDISINGRLFTNLTSYQNNSIPYNAVQSIGENINNSVTTAFASIQSSSAAANVSQNPINLDSISFANNWIEIQNTAYNWSYVAMSLTGQYQIASDASGNIYGSNSFGTYWTLMYNVTNMNWTRVGLSYNGNIQVAAGNINSNNVYTNYIYISTSYGVNWNVVYTNSANVTKQTFISSIALSADGKYQYATINVSGLIYSSNYGNNWLNSSNITITSDNLFCSTSSSGQYISLTGSNSFIYISANYGSSFSTINSIGALNCYSSTMSYTGQYILVSTGSYVAINNAVTPLPQYLYFSSNYGNSFSPLLSSSLLVWTHSKMSGTGQYMIAFGNSSFIQPLTIYYSNNYGLSWSSVQNSQLASNWSGVTISATGEYVTILGAGNNIFTSVTSLYNQSYTGTLSTNNINVTGSLSITGTVAPFQLSDKSYIATGSLPLDYCYNFGTLWRTVTGSTSFSFNNIAMSITGQYQTAVSNTFINYSCNFGNTWNTINPLGSVGWQFIAMSGNGQYQYAVPTIVLTGGNLNLLSGTTAYLYYSSTFGVSWLATQTPQLWYCISCSSSGQYVMAGGIKTGLTFSSNYGINWNTIGSADIVGSTAKWWSCVSMSSSGQYLYAIALSSIDLVNNSLNTIGDNIYYSNNYGTNWIQSTIRINAANISSANSVVPNATNYGGKFWQSISSSASGQFIYACASTNQAYIYNPSDTAYRFFNFNDTIYYSSDYGKNFIGLTTITNTLWQYVSISSSGQYIAAANQVAAVPNVGIASNAQVNTVGNIYTSIDFGNTFTKRDATALYNGIAVSSSAQFIVACSSNNGLIIAATPSPYINISNNMDIYGNLTVTGRVTAASFNATSDQRIKKNINEINNNFALDTIRKIKPVSYELIDKPNNSNKQTWGFIAQQIQNVLDHSVTHQTNYIPNIYEIVNINENTVILNDKYTYDISLSYTPVKLKFINYYDGSIIYNTIDKIIDSKTILLNEPFDSSFDYLFLYGQEVNDFLSVNYDSVFTITTTAVKQIDIELQEAKETLKDQSDTIIELKSEISDLKSQIAILMKAINK